MRRLLFLLILLGSTSCRSVNREQSDPQGFVTNADDTWAKAKIEVCWQGAMRYPKSETAVANTIQKEYKALGIRFQGWQDCPADPGDRLAVFWADDEPSSRATIGYQRDKNSMRLLIGGYTCPIGYLESNCLLNVAVHEFGHVLGLHHEMNRFDGENLNCKHQQQVGERNGLQIGDADAVSVMNYCQLYTANAENRYMGLSPRDRATLDELYFGRVARLELTLSGDYAYMLPIKVMADEFSGKVFGPRISRYRFQFVSSDQSCSAVSSWSQDRSIQQSIQASDLPRPIDELLDRNLKICLLGGDWLRWQKLENASSLIFQITREPPPRRL